MMNFEEILKQWETSRAKDAGRKPEQGPGKKANAPTREEKSARAGSGPEPSGSPGKSAKPAERNPADYLNHWLTMHGVEDKDGGSQDMLDDRQRRIDEAERVRRMRPQAVLDLHGQSAAEAESSISRFLFDSSRRGLEKVLLIHGKGLHSAGEPVMEEVVRKAIERNTLAGSFGFADRSQGGRGATWVRLKKRDYFSR
jgi:DNA-nicking Smr family endonuclease